jgi:hypothetical protein
MFRHFTPSTTCFPMFSLFKYVIVFIFCLFLIQFSYFLYLSLTVFRPPFQPHYGNISLSSPWRPLQSISAFVLTLRPDGRSVLSRRFSRHLYASEALRSSAESTFLLRRLLPLRHCYFHCCCLIFLCYELVN